MYVQNVFCEMYFIVRKQKYRIDVSNFTLRRIMLPKTFLRYFFLSEDCFQSNIYIYIYS